MSNSSHSYNIPSDEVVQQRFAEWYQAMELSHEMLMAGLRSRIGPDGDIQQAYRDWYDQYQALKWPGASTPFLGPDQDVPSDSKSTDTGAKHGT
jgi:hypothetical protein